VTKVRDWLMAEAADYEAGIADGKPLPA